MEQNRPRVRIRVLVWVKVWLVVSTKSQSEEEGEIERRSVWVRERCEKRMVVMREMAWCGMAQFLVRKYLVREVGLEAERLGPSLQ